VVGAQWIFYPLLAQAFSPLLHGCTTGTGLVLAGSSNTGTSWLGTCW
jgi:hypothetical protein